jgi:hypothetical protein
VGLNHAVERTPGSLLQLVEGPAHVVGRIGVPPERVENGALEITQPGEAEGLDGANHGGVGRVGEIAEHRRRARQRDLAIFIDEPRDAAAGRAEPGIGGAQQPIKLAVGSR